MGQLYTSGDWVTKPGREDDFVAAWEEFALWTTENVSGAVWAVLTKHDAEPNRFRSFGSWENQEAIEAWRASPDFQQAIGKMKELLESFEAHTLEAVVEIG